MAPCHVPGGSRTTSRPRTSSTCLPGSEIRSTSSAVSRGEVSTPRNISWRPSWGGANTNEGLTVPYRPLPSHTASSRPRFPAERNHEADGENERREPDDERDERLGCEPPLGEADREPGTGHERRRPVPREATPADVLQPEGIELPGGHDRGRVLEQQVHFVGRLVDRHAHAPHRGGEHVRVAQLFALAGRERTVHRNRVAAPGHDLGRDVPLPDPELVATGGMAPAQVGRSVSRATRVATPGFTSSSSSSTSREP